MDTMFSDGLDRLLAAHCSPARVREVEDGGSAQALWSVIDASGFADALVGEAAGGAGLALADAFALFGACGRTALPVPLGHTMLVRAALASAGQSVPLGPLTIGRPTRGADADAGIDCQGVPFGAVADWVLVPEADGSWLLPVAAARRRASGVHGSLQAHLQWPSRPGEAIRLEADWPWLAIGAVVTAAMMAGAMQQVLDATLDYANQRVQFGKPIGRFQAVQQQLSVMAEQVFAARMAADIGCHGDGVVPTLARAACAKARAGEAAERVVAIAHGVHGAIGVTAEYDLQLFTRRLQEWRNDYGAAPYWHARLGADVLAQRGRSTLHYLLDRLAPSIGP